MDEQLMFTRIHDALDIQPPAGAYERLRTELTKKPVQPRRWPGLNTRWTSMSFRLAAGLAILAIAAATAAAIIAIHNGSGNSSPAGSRMSIQAYQKMILDDNAAATATFSAPCDIGVHSGCGADASRAIPVVQKWIDDVSRPDIPQRYAVINDVMRLHLIQNIAAQHDLLAASRAGDGPGMDRAFWVALYAGLWTSQVVPAIQQSHPVDAASYAQLVASETRTLDACGASCGFTGTAVNCVLGEGLTCQQFFDSGPGPHFDGYEADLAKVVPPASLADASFRLQTDLARAEAALMTLRVAIAANDQVGINIQIKLIAAIKTQIDIDSARITG